MKPWRYSGHRSVRENAATVDMRQAAVNSKMGSSLNHRYVSLGGACDAAMMLDTLKLRDEAYPFDWLWNLNHGLAAVNDIIEARFVQILGEDAYYSGLHHRVGRNVVLYKSFPSIIHMHSDPMNNRAEHEKIVRRISRFNEMLRSKDQLHFIYYANLNEIRMVNATLTNSILIDELILQGTRFMSFMSKKGHGKRTTLLLVLQTDVEFEAQAIAALAHVNTGDERIHMGYTISRNDGSPALLKRWKRQWADIITTRTNMPEYMVRACRSELEPDL